MARSPKKQEEAIAKKEPPKKTAAPRKRKAPAKAVALTEDIFTSVCDQIAEGKSLLEILKKRGMPSYSRFMARLQENPEWQDKYAGAREASADADADKVGFVSQQALDGKIDPAAARVAIDGFKWSAGKRKPKVYGDRQTIDLNRNDADRSDAEILSEIAKLSSKLSDVFGEK